MEERYRVVEPRLCHTKIAIIGLAVSILYIYGTRGHIDFLCLLLSSVGVYIATIAIVITRCRLKIKNRFPIEIVLINNELLRLNYTFGSKDIKINGYTIEKKNDESWIVRYIRGESVGWVEVYPSKEKN